MTESATQVVFIGGTLDGKKQGRLLRGYAPHTIMEQVCSPVGKDNDMHYKNITRRQVYSYEPAIKRADGALCYRLTDVVVA